MKQKQEALQSITIKAALRTRGEASVIVYEKGTDNVLATVPFEKSDYEGIVRSAVIEGFDPAQIEYNFLVGDEILQDEKAQLIRGRKPFGKRPAPAGEALRCGFAAADFDWGDDAPLRLPYADTVSYYLHVRGYTKHPRSGVVNKGTFSGIIEKIPHIKSLGVNQIILMPAYEFEETNEKDSRINYWGYTKSWYFAPKAGYAAGDEPDVEFKTMIRSLHKEGIEVIMEFAFPDSSAMSFMEECLSWWVREYHVDGFLLTVCSAFSRMLAASPLLADVKLMTGYFDTDILPAPAKGFPKVLADMNDGFKTDCRRLLKGDEDTLGAFAQRMRQNYKEKACINYIAGHDGFTLMDLVSYERKYNEDNGEHGRDGAAVEYSWNCGAEGPSRKGAVKKLRMRQMKNAMAMVFLAQGTPMLLAGDEFGNSQKGNNNPWCQDNEISWIDWGREQTNRELTDFIRLLAEIRKKHPVLHLDRPLTGQDTASCGFPDFSCHSSRAWVGAFEYQNRHIGLMYCLCGDEEDYIYAAFNLHWDPQSFALPYLPDGVSWQVQADTSGTLDLNENPERELTLPGRSVAILAGERKGSSSEN